MYYIAKINQKGTCLYLMTDGVWRPRPAWCANPKTKYDKVRAKSWVTYLWRSDNELTAKLFLRALTTGKRLKNKPFIANGVTY